MTPYEINKSSWHYRLCAKRARNLRTCTDICEYSRKVCFSVLNLLIEVALYGILVTAIAYVATSTAFGIMLWCNTGLVFMDHGFLIGIIIASCVAVLAVFTAAWLLIEMVVKSCVKERKPNFVKLAYRSWANKYCSRIVFK